MPVVVPSAPEVQETTRMLEDSESVSSWATSPATMSRCVSHACQCAGHTDPLCWPRRVKQTHSFIEQVYSEYLL